MTTENELEFAREFARRISAKGKTPKEIARSLYSPSGLDLSVEEVARVLYSPNGLDLSAVETALAMRDALGISAKKITRVMGVIRGY